MRRADPPAAENGRPAAAAQSTGSGAEQMRPDPVDTYADVEVDVMDTEVRDAGMVIEDSAYVRSILSETGSTERSSRAEFDGDAADPADGALADPDSADAVASDPADEYVGRPGAVGGLLVVLQSILAVAFGGGLFIVFDQLWRWNSIVALVLTVLVTLGLVAAATGTLDFAFAAEGWLWLGLASLVSTVLAVVLFFSGMSRVGPSTAAILSTLEPPVTVALVFVTFGEALGAVQLLGALAILGAAVIVNLPATRAAT
jgi:uncharacterized membrane protein